MPHPSVGTTVTYMRPLDVKGKRTLIPTQATVIGVEPQEDASPRFHLAFLHPDRLEALTGSGWREAFDRAMSVRPQSDPLVAANKDLPYYRENLPVPMVKKAAQPVQSAGPVAVPAATSASPAATPAPAVTAGQANNKTT